MKFSTGAWKWSILHPPEGANLAWDRGLCRGVAGSHQRGGRAVHPGFVDAHHATPMANVD